MHTKPSNSDLPGESNQRMGRILLVDDDESVRHVIRQILVQNEYPCETVADAIAARALLSKRRFDLILCDIQMPGESGLDLTAFVREAYPDIAVVMITVINDMHVARRAVELGIYGYLVKPIDRNQILIGVANALRRRNLEIKERRFKQHLEQMIRSRTAELRKANSALRKREAELETRNQELGELNSALSVLLKKREKDRAAIEENVLANLRAVVQPCLQRLRSTGHLNTRQIGDLNILEKGIDTLVSPFAKQLSTNYYDLTQTETQIATMIQQGKSTKEIAGVLNLSVNTIMTHRHRIRTKLGLVGTQQSLYGFLNTLLYQ